MMTTEITPRANLALRRYGDMSDLLKQKGAGTPASAVLLPSPPRTGARGWGRGGKSLHVRRSLPLTPAPLPRVRGRGKKGGPSPLPLSPEYGGEGRSNGQPHRLW